MEILTTLALRPGMHVVDRDDPRAGKQRRLRRHPPRRRHLGRVLCGHHHARPGRCPALLVGRDRVTGAVIALTVVIGAAACVSGFVLWLLLKVVRTDRRRGGGR